MIVARREASVDDAVTVTRMVAALVAMKGRVSGFLALSSNARSASSCCRKAPPLFARGTYDIITELYVVPDQRSSEVAMRLIEAAVGLGTKKGWGQLEVGAPNQPVWSRMGGRGMR